MFLTYNGSSPSQALSWSPNGKFIASTSNGYDERVRVWNASTGQNILSYTGHSSKVRTIAWSPDGKHIASGGDDSTVQIWNDPSG